MKIPTFKGKNDLKAYLEREKKVDWIFNCHHYIEYKKAGRYARDCWNPTRKVKENVNFDIEDEKETTLLLVHNELIQANKNI